MIRRFNYTGRIKIPRDRVDISLLKDSEGKHFKVRLNLEGLPFPPDAKVFIEPNYKGVYQRFDFGTVGHFAEPQNTRLSELPETELAYFDISVVDESKEVGLLLGTAKGIPVGANSLPNDRIPLLYVNPTDLDNQFWKLTFDSNNDGRPILEINNRIPELYEMAKNDIKFISLVYTAAFRGVLIKILEEGDVDTDQEHWITHWITFINKVLGVTSPPENDSDSATLTTHQEIWIDDCINAYSKKFQLLEKFTSL